MTIKPVMLTCVIEVHGDEKKKTAKRSTSISKLTARTKTMTMTLLMNLTYRPGMIRITQAPSCRLTSMALSKN
jgi:hypothetical protein